jgi:hypothetical protein
MPAKLSFVAQVIQPLDGIKRAFPPALGNIRIFTNKYQVPPLHQE